jgi:hypothetical protein
MKEHPFDYVGSLERNFVPFWADEGVPKGVGLIPIGEWNGDVNYGRRILSTVLALVKGVLVPFRGRRRTV